MNDQMDFRYWLKEIDENGVDSVESQPTDPRSTIGQARERALVIYYRKQQYKEARKSIGISKNTRLAAWIAAFAAVLTLAVTCKAKTG